MQKKNEAKFLRLLVDGGGISLLNVFYYKKVFKEKINLNIFLFYEIILLLFK